MSRAALFPTTALLLLALGCILVEGVPNVFPGVVDADGNVQSLDLSDFGDFNFGVRGPPGARRGSASGRRRGRVGTPVEGQTVPTNAEGNPTSPGPKEGHAQNLTSTPGATGHTVPKTEVSVPTVEEPADPTVVQIGKGSEETVPKSGTPDATPVTPPNTLQSPEVEGTLQSSGTADAKTVTPPNSEERKTGKKRALQSSGTPDAMPDTPPDTPPNREEEGTLQSSGTADATPDTPPNPEEQNTGEPTGQKVGTVIKPPEGNTTQSEGVVSNPPAPPASTTTGDSDREQGTTKQTPEGATKPNSETTDDQKGPHKEGMDRNTSMLTDITTSDSLLQSVDACAPFRTAAQLLAPIMALIGTSLVV